MFKIFIFMENNIESRTSETITRVKTIIIERRTADSKNSPCTYVYAQCSEKETCFLRLTTFSVPRKDK